ncbi:hypothetical protein PILCRDRAFT_828082 [Piloderma croceum F 1598]|uniref:Uncharacterized protein n=1 Tax=Piloderma croceum (strain F 1598) TaxID=765440 RepID=A0A0C3F389_PILCF|nr:hypothetical protein PILCRDRAFT_828082 [Piloderma croceum F 1598]
MGDARYTIQFPLITLRLPLFPSASDLKSNCLSISVDTVIQHLIRSTCSITSPLNDPTLLTPCMRLFVGGGTMFRGGYWVSAFGPAWLQNPL